MRSRQAEVTFTVTATQKASQNGGVNHASRIPNPGVVRSNRAGGNWNFKALARSTFSGVPNAVRPRGPRVRSPAEVHSVRRSTGLQIRGPLK